MSDIQAKCRVHCVCASVADCVLSLCSWHALLDESHASKHQALNSQTYLDLRSLVHALVADTQLHGSRLTGVYTS